MLAHRLDVSLRDDRSRGCLLGGVDLRIVSRCRLDDQERNEGYEQQRQRHIAKPAQEKTYHGKPIPGRNTVTMGGCEGSLSCRLCSVLVPLVRTVGIHVAEVEVDRGLVEVAIDIVQARLDDDRLRHQTD